VVNYEVFLTPHVNYYYHIFLVTTTMSHYSLSLLSPSLSIFVTIIFLGQLHPLSSHWVIFLKNKNKIENSVKLKKL